MSLNLTDIEIVKRLVQKDEVVTRWFFYEKCRPLLLSLMRSIFDHPVDYDEVVNSVYLLLMENDAQRLRSFGFRCSLCQWLKVVCTNHLTNKRNGMFSTVTDKPLYEGEEDSVDMLEREEAARDLERLFAAIRSHREVYVIRRMMLDDAPSEEVAAELQVSVDYLYVIKQRAMKDLTEIAINDHNRRILL